MYKNKIAAYKFYIQQQFQYVISHFQDLTSGLNVNQVLGLNLDFDFPRYVDSTQSQPMWGGNVTSSTINHEPYVLFCNHFSF